MSIFTQIRSIRTGIKKAKRDTAASDAFEIEHDKMHDKLGKFDCHKMASDFYHGLAFDVNRDDWYESSAYTAYVQAWYAAKKRNENPLDQMKEMMAALGIDLDNIKMMQIPINIAPGETPDKVAQRLSQAVEDTRALANLDFDAETIEGDPDER